MQGASLQAESVSQKAFPVPSGLRTAGVAEDAPEAPVVQAVPSQPLLGGGGGGGGGDRTGGGGEGGRETDEFE